ncbi:hypothetical protein N8479_02685, partial [Flavobacteriaceae bacterium]|nr:hypothetical protein [Flavobacteriaceae bacterium]
MKNIFYIFVFISSSLFSRDYSLTTFFSSYDKGDSSSVSLDLSSGVKEILNTSLTHTALKSESVVVAWDSTDTSTKATVSGTDLVGNVYAGTESITFTIDNTTPTVALTDSKSQDNSVITWGNSSSGGDSSSVSLSLSSGVTEIFSNYGAFA